MMRLWTRSAVLLGAEGGTDPFTSESQSDTSRSCSVRRSRFFFEHADSCGLHDVYDVTARVIGKGGFGSIRRATLKSAPSIVRAIKAVAIGSGKERDMVQREVSILRSLDHPYICRIYETFHDSRFMYMVMEFVDGEDLFDYIERALDDQPLTESLVCEIMLQFFSGLDYCHQKGIVHRDIKPENIMVWRSPAASGLDTRPQIKLIDFGLASKKTLDFGKKSYSFIGTFDYLPPEALEGDGMDEPSLDMWSAGMVLHLLLVGELPDAAIREGEQTLDIGDEAYRCLPTAAQELLASLVKVDPGERGSAAEACRRCSIPWVLDEAGTGGTVTNLTTAGKAFAQFHKHHVLRRAVLTALATQCTSGDFVNLYHEFLAMDTDKNGQVSRMEMAVAISHHLPPDAAADTQNLMLSIFDAIDTDGSEEIEFTEYLAAVLDEAGCRCEETIRAAFHVFDADRSGTICCKELSRVLNFTDDEVKAYMASFDANADGELDFDEFRAWFEQGTTTGKLAKSRTWRFGRSHSLLRKSKCQLFAF